MLFIFFPPYLVAIFELSRVFIKYILTCTTYSPKMNEYVSLERPCPTLANKENKN